MATRSRIAIETPEGHVKSIYCHFDGYPEGNGKLLHKHYGDRSKVEKLIGLGDISFLAPEVEPTDVHTFNDPQEGVVTAYHRDRGEELRNQLHVDSRTYFKGDVEEFGYLFTKEGDWVYVSSDDRNPRTCAGIS
jgi:hypothetical protein